MLDGHARSEANEAIGMTEERPGGLHGRRVLLAVKRFELVPEGAQVRSTLITLARSRRFVAGVSDAVQARLGLPAADGEVHGAILRIDNHVGQRQRPAV